MRTGEQAAAVPGSTASGRAVVAALAGLLVVVVLGAGAWLLATSREGPEADGEPLPMAAGTAGEVPAPEPGGSVAFVHAPAAEGRALAEEAPRTSKPLAGEAGAPPVIADGWLDLHGVVVRASDGSAIADATVIAVPRDEDAEGGLAPPQALTGPDGSFTLPVPPGIGSFRVQLPQPGRAAGDARPGERVPVNAEWTAPDGRRDEVRLVAETGWRLEVRLVDGEGRPREGVLVKGAGRAGRSDAEGRCVFLDLPVESGPISLTVLAGPGEKPLTLDLPERKPGSLSQEVSFAVR